MRLPGGIALSAIPDPEHYDHCLLIEEPPLQVLPSLAQAIGLEEAIVVQQLHYLLRDQRNGKTVGGHRWIYNTYAEWEESFFPFWSNATIRRIFDRLEKMLIVISCQPEGGFSRRKYYRLNAGVMNLIRKGKLPKPPKTKELTPSAQFEQIVCSNPTLPIAKKTSKEDLAKEAKGTPDGGSLVFSAKWKPDDRSKEDKLRSIPAPRDYPSEREFNDFIDSALLGGLDARRSTENLYETMCQNKWRVWEGGRWRKIADWRKFITGLNGHIERNIDQHSKARRF